MGGCFLLQGDFAHQAEHFCFLDVLKPWLQGVMFASLEPIKASDAVNHSVGHLFSDAQ